MLAATVAVAAVGLAPAMGVSAASAATKPPWEVTTSGAWSQPQPDASGILYCGGTSQQTCAAAGVGTYPGTEIRWGTPVSGGPADKSGLGYAGYSKVEISQGQQVALGRFDVFNFPVVSGTAKTSAKLDVAVSLTDGTTTLTGNLPVTVNYDETPNRAPCPYPSPQNNPCSDKVSYTFYPFSATSGGQLYTVSVTGFSTSQTDSSQVTPNAIVNENTQTWFYLFASFTIGHPPVANAGPDQTVEQAGPDTTTVTLDGTASTDPDNDPLSYVWTWHTATGYATATGAQPSVQLPAGETPVSLTVSDGQSSKMDAVYITVVDTLPPTITGDAQPAANPAGWNNTPVTVSWTCADTGSGITATGCPQPTKLSQDGAGQSATGTATDNAGHTASATVSGINIDQAAPTLSGAVVETANTHGWYRSDVHVAWTCADTGGSDLATDCPANTTIRGEGDQLTATQTISDYAGNTTSATSPAVRIDRQAPTSTITNVPEGWSASAVQVSLTADDNLSGVEALHYTLDGGDEHTLAEGGTVDITGDGSHTVTYWAVDNAGNTEAAHQATVRIDGTPPVITHTLDPVPTGLWNRGDTTVTFTCADSGGSGLASCAGDGTETGEGRHTRTGTATDNAGNTATDTATVNIDATGPAVTTSRSANPNDAGWYRAPVTVTFTCADPKLADGTGGSGVADCPAAVTLKTDGAAQAVTGTARDLAGNTATATDDGINIDQAAPSVTGAIVTTASHEGWYADDVTVHWTCADAGGSGLSAPCPPDTTVTGTGIGLSASVTVTDKAGNATTAVVGGINIDRVNPTITGQATTRANDAGWYNTPVTVHWTCADDLSGLAADHGCSADTTLHADGANQSVTGTAQDKAGNTAHATVDGINIDQTPPTLTGSPRETPNAAGWYNTDVTIDWAAEDTGSGVDPLVVPAATLIATEGHDQTVSESVSDRAGNNTGPVRSAAVNIDKTAPTTTANAPSGWSNGTVTIDLPASDNLSGVAATRYNLDGGAEQTGNSVTFNTEGRHTLTYYSVDAAGNSEAPHSAEVLIDHGAPTITHTLTPEPNPAGWNNAPVSVKFTCADPALADGTAGSGIASCGPDSTVATDGANQNAAGTATDNAGNTATDTASVSLDQVNPTITAAFNRAPNANGWYNTPVAVGFTCDDALSGVAHCPSDQQLGHDGRNQSATGTATDVAGNTAGTTLDGINIDQTPPTITGATDATPNAHGWYRTPVTVHFTASDALSGLDPATTPIDTTVGEGSNQTVTATVADLAGNTATATVSGLNVDTTKPSITATLSVAAPNSKGWYNQPVTIHFNCTDALSGIDTCPPDVTLTDGANQKVTGTTTDVAGNTAAVTVSGINIDTDAPVITFSGNAGTYQVDQSVTITCTATDAVSGIATSTCPSMTAVPAYTLPLGTNTLTATATDKAGNTSQATTSYTVAVTCASLEQLTTTFSTSADIAHALNVKLDAACSATTAGGRAGSLNAYANQVRAQTGKTLTADQAAVLTRLAGAL